MNTHEWALIVFTILNQLAVGSMLVMVILHTYITNKKGAELANKISNKIVYYMVPVVVVATLASLFHLGYPLHAPYAITHLGSSWLSREILGDLLFAGLVVVLAFLQWRNLGSASLRKALAWIAAIVGLVLVYIMSSVYMLPTEPYWNTFATPVLFYCTAFLLGSLADGVILALSSKSANAADESGLVRDAMRGIAITAIVFLGIELVVTPIMIAFVSTTGAAGVASANMLIGSYGVLFVLHLILAFIGAGVFGVFLYRNAVNNGHEKTIAYLAYSAFAIVLVAEVLGRFLFYAARVRIGI